MAVLVNNEEEYPLPQKVMEAIETIAAKALVAHGMPADAEISLTFCGDRAIHALNKQWRCVDRPTDVLSFPLFADEEGPGIAGGLLLGDIVISLERAAAQAKEYGHSPEREILYLFTHGLLHLLGYDHLQEEDKPAMRSFEEELLSGVGVLRDES